MSSQISAVLTNPSVRITAGIEVEVAA